MTRDGSRSGVVFYVEVVMMVRRSLSFDERFFFFQIADLRIL